ncbi:hypothetical protein L6452_02763 [Arctium lappa]|uniref:Uncharacterized protein n=1 Tax=Arctium lappa TaxID=4217 RepID=A0ACB9FLY3_ARCLA|nr:hypothetical protein L6452_02763 [Arctium lappa]
MKKKRGVRRSSTCKPPSSAVACRALACLPTYTIYDCHSRVLLDGNHRAIVSDLGLLKLMTRDESRVLTTLHGTKAPERLLELGEIRRVQLRHGVVRAHRRNVTGGIDETEVKKMLHVALWCIQEKVRRRPTMMEVVGRAGGGGGSAGDTDDSGGSFVD